MFEILVLYLSTSISSQSGNIVLSTRLYLRDLVTFPRTIILFLMFLRAEVFL